MHGLVLIRAAAEDVASARVLLQERINALEDIVRSALKHDLAHALVAEARQAALPERDHCIAAGGCELAA